MTYIYDISQFRWSWCLNDRLAHSNHNRSSNFGYKIVKKFKNSKTRRKFFPFINFENPLYFLAELEVPFGLTFVIARNLIFWANHIRIKIWMGINCKLIQYPKKLNYAIKTHSFKFLELDPHYTFWLYCLEKFTVRKVIGLNLQS